MQVSVRQYDWIITGTMLLLFALGATMLFSATEEGHFLSSRLARQLASLVVAVLVYFIVSVFPYRFWSRYAVALYLSGIAALLVVGQIAPVIRGTASRLQVMGVQIQPSEFVKVTVVVILAWLFAKFKASRVSLLSSGIVVVVVAGLIAIEPDIGEATLIVLLWGALVVYMGFSWRVIGMITLLGVLTLVVAWYGFMADYQKNRLMTFIDPTYDPLGAGYNVTQSIVALGSGGLLGRGLGHGPQSQLKFLPERHTDFIVASLGEELGFVGVSLVLGLYVVLLGRILKIGRNTRDPFGRYLSVAVFLILLINFFISVGINMGLLPVTGIPLPLVSYGGSNLVGTVILLGLVQSVKCYSQWLKNPPVELSELT